MRTEYRIDDFQQNYFVIPSFEELLRLTVETDFAPLYEELKALPDIPVARIEPEDVVITEGTQDYANVKGGRRDCISFAHKSHYPGEATTPAKAGAQLG